MTRADLRILSGMARHRAPDVASPLHGPSPTAGHPTGTGRPRHAASGPARVNAPERRGRHRGPPSPSERPAAAGRTGTHRARPALEVVGPLVVEVPTAPPALLEVTPTPALAVLTPVPTPIPTSPPVPAPTQAPGYPAAETVAWAGFASLVSCGVVAGGQGPREEALWILGVSGGALSVISLGMFGLRRRRHRRA